MVPWYDLDIFKGLICEGQYRITSSALQGALLLGHDSQDICECLLEYLNQTHFYKSMPAERVPGLWQDVYKINYQGFPLYLKLQIGATGLAVIISFKEDTS